MKTYRYTFERRGSRHRCPNCGSRRDYTRFVDGHTDELLPEEYGKCNRVDRCGYFLSPYHQDESGSSYAQRNTSGSHQPGPPADEKPMSLIPRDTLSQSLQGYDQNNFVRFLLSVIGKENISLIEQAIQRYYLGSSLRYPGAVVFWQIDQYNRVRTGKIMQYNADTGKRLKENGIAWVHTVYDKYNLEQCLFGAHLLASNLKAPIAIVESEKTAVIASIVYPGYVWLATGGKSNLNAEKLAPLKGRQVVLFPDLGSYNDWLRRANEIDNSILVSDQLEKVADEADKVNGLDLADYLISVRLRVKQPQRTIEAICCETIVPNYSMVLVRLDDGSYADMLFDSDGNPADLTHPDAIQLAEEYKKQFYDQFITERV